MTQTVPGSVMAARKEAARTLRRARAIFAGSAQPKPEAVTECIDLIGQARGALSVLGAEVLAQRLHGVEGRVQGFVAGSEPWENVRRLFSGAIGTVERRLRVENRAGNGLRPGDMEEPASRAAGSPGEPAEAPLREARQLFERGLLQLLRDRSDRATLSQMLSAVQIALLAARTDADREFWNVSAAVMEAMIHGGVKPDAYCKRYCARLNLLLSRPVGEEGLNVPLPFAEAMHILDSSRPVTARIQAIQLGSAVPSATRPADALAQVAPDPQLAAQVCKTLREYLERFEAGDDAVVEEFRRVLSGRFEHDLQSVMPEWVVPRVLRVVQRYGMPDQTRCIESAAAVVVFMEAEFAADEISTERVTKFAAWLAEADEKARAPLSRAGKSFSEPVPMDLIQAPAALKLAVAAVRARMRVGEQLLEEYFSGSMDQDLAGSILECLEQIAGALQMLQLPRAAAALRACETRLSRLSRDARAMPESERDRLIEAFCTLGAYVDGIEEDAECIEDLMRDDLLPLEIGDPGMAAQDAGARSERDAQPSAIRPVTVSADSAAVPSTTVTAVVADEDDRLSIFVEEAESVLEELASLLRPGAQVLEHDAAAAEIRRAFHTLKGSSRMVGLQPFSNAAWRLEQVFDRWVDGRQGEGLELHRLATYAHDVLGRSVSNLSGPVQSDEELGEIERLAQRVIDGQSLADSSTEAELVPSVEAPGDADAITMSAPPSNLQDIYAREANNHLALLQRACQELEGEPSGRVRAEMVRAAHTLASASATMRYTEVNVLAAALEGNLAALVRVGTAPSVAALGLIRSAIGALEAMIGEVLQGRTTQVDAELIIALNQVEAVAAGDAEAADVPVPPRGDVTKPAVQGTHLDDDFDSQLVPSFVAEADDLLPVIATALRQLRAQSGDAAAVANLLRRLHTLKGSARMAGAMAIGAMIHDMESAVRAGQGAADFPASAVEQLEDELDRVTALMEPLRRHAIGPASVPPASDLPGEVPADLAPAAPDQSQFPRFLRVDVEMVDRLVNDSGEMVVARAGIERELHALDSALREQMERLARLRAQFNELEIQADAQLRVRPAAEDASDTAFDPLEFDRYTRLQELTRMMAETVSDLGAIRQNMARSVDTSIAALVTQTRVTKQVQKDLVSLRMVPFSSIAHRLYRVVRQAAKDTGKRANLDIHGGEVRVDRSVLDRVTAPLEHLLRNSIAHGLEDTARRQSAGKSDIGQITLHVRQEAGEIEIVHRDDGAGLDLGRIREQAAARQLIGPSEQPDESELTELIFLPGFSTVSTPTDLAGRGVGLDVVQTEIRLLGGHIDVTSTPGLETVFTVRLPVSVAMSRMLVVKAERNLYALPSQMLHHVMLVEASQMREARASGKVNWRTLEYRMGLLPHAFERTGPPAEPAAGAIVLVADREDRLGLEVEAVVGQFDLIIKSIGTQFARVSGVTGAAILPGGEVVLALNPFLARMPRVLPVVPDGVAVAAARPLRRALVVDDSLTVRQITGRLLAKDGFEVATAKDGLEALGQIKENPPHLVILDIEMPRMDGFELMQTLKGDPATQHIGIVVITSRSAQKHRQHAMDSGADEFLGKPYSDEELLTRVHALESVLAERSAARSENPA